jgi:hypothetical protein
VRVVKECKRAQYRGAGWLRSRVQTGRIPGVRGDSKRYELSVLLIVDKKSPPVIGAVKTVFDPGKAPDEEPEEPNTV